MITKSISQLLYARPPKLYPRFIFSFLVLEMETLAELQKFAKEAQEKISVLEAKIAILEVYPSMNCSFPLEQQKE